MKADVPRLCKEHKGGPSGRRDDEGWAENLYVDDREKVKDELSKPAFSPRRRRSARGSAACHGPGPSSRHRRTLHLSLPARPLRPSGTKSAAALMQRAHGLLTRIFASDHVSPITYSLFRFSTFWPVTGSYCLNLPHQTGSGRPSRLPSSTARDRGVARQHATCTSTSGCTLAALNGRQPSPRTRTGRL
jgi:hypothetical protein